MVNGCCLCNDSSESTDHILIHYELISRLWSLVTSLLGVPLVK